jgi:hypothetical protein
VTDEDPREEYDVGYRARPPLFVFGGLAVGLLVGFLLAALLGGNPFTASNRVEYRDITVGSLQEDRICWSMEPGRRDADQTCAILAVDPTLPVPGVGEAVTVGLVDMRTPLGEEFRQVVWFGGGPVEPTPGATPGVDATPTPAETPMG